MHENRGLQVLKHMETKYYFLFNTDTKKYDREACSSRNWAPGAKLIDCFKCTLKTSPDYFVHPDFAANKRTK